MKVAIPKEEIEKITSTYRCTEQDAAKAYLTAKEKADQVFTAFLNKEFEPRESRLQQMAPAIFTPREIKNHQDKYVIGQEAYKKDWRLRPPIIFLVGPELYGPSIANSDHQKDGPG